MTWNLPIGMRSAIDAEADRRGVPPSRVVEEILARFLPEFVAAALQETLRAGEAAVSLAGDAARSQRPQ